MGRGIIVINQVKAFEFVIVYGKYFYKDQWSVCFFYGNTGGIQ